MRVEIEFNVTGRLILAGAAVDESVAAQAQKLAGSADPVGEITEGAAQVDEPAKAEDAPEIGNGTAETGPEAAEEPVPTPAPAFAGEAAPLAPQTADEVNEAPALPEKAPAAADAEESKEDEQKEEAVPAAEGGDEAAASPKAGSKRRAEEPAEDALAAKVARYEVDPEDPNAGYFKLIAEIPTGETRTFSDIAVGAGAKPTMARSIGRTLAKVATEDPGLPWWRVVSAMGALQSHPERQELQLERLRAEGARPREGENVADWAVRVGAKVVGTYALGSLRMVYAEADNDDVSVRFGGGKRGWNGLDGVVLKMCGVVGLPTTSGLSSRGPSSHPYLPINQPFNLVPLQTFNPHCVEPFPSKDAATARGFSRMV